MGVRRISLCAGLSVLILAVLACTINVGGPAYPDQRVPSSPDAAGELQSSVQTAVAASSDSGKISLIITEGELTSFLSTYLQQQSQLSLSDPQVFLRNGQIKIFGTATQGYFQANIEIIVAAGVDAQGQLTIEVTSADFGPFPVPAGLKDAISATIQEAYTGSIGPAAVGFRLENITISDGTMQIVGRIK
jgi:hypothetical protein